MSDWYLPVLFTRLTLRSKPANINCDTEKRNRTGSTIENLFTFFRKGKKILEKIKWYFDDIWNPQDKRIYKRNSNEIFNVFVPDI